MPFVEFSSQTKNPEVPEVTDITAEDVQAKISDVKLVDVRRAEEYSGELGHIAGSELMTLDTLEGCVENLPKDKTIVFICRSGRRSITASAIAQNKGYSSVFNMVGGMIRWNELGFEVQK